MLVETPRKLLLVVCGWCCCSELSAHASGQLVEASPAAAQVAQTRSGIAQRQPLAVPTTSEATRARHLKYEQHALRHAGDPNKGAQLFRSERTKCAVCHKVGGRGGEVGRDLSSVGGKYDRPHLIESLLEPSRQIVEGFRTTNIVTRSGRVLSGIVKVQSDTEIQIADAEGRLQTVARADIEQQTLSPVSLMPTGLAQQLSPTEFTDLIAYLESLRAGVKDRMGAGVVGAIAMPEEVEVQTIATGLDGATALDVLPDGRVLICEQPGRVRLVENDELVERPVVELPVDSHWERGVIGVTHDPQFPKVPHIYVCWVAKEPHPHHRVSRFTLAGNTVVPGSEKLLLSGDNQSKMGGKVPAGHQGGALHFGVDGCLYIGIGEQTAGTPSQELNTLLGKLLRINRDGSIPEDNPFYNRTQGKYRAIWARGCRNPFTFAVRDQDGLMLINDVGGKFEEVNVGRAGANYGWPVVEHGDRPQYATAEYDGPIHWYPQSSINGGDFCPANGAWSQRWRDRYFFADFVEGWIDALNPDNPRDVKRFATGVRRPVDLRFGPDGSLYVLLRNAWVVDDKFAGGTGSLLRFRPRGKSAPSQAKQTNSAAGTVQLTANAVDRSAGGLPAFKVVTPSATYFLEKTGGGLSSLVDRDGNDWLGFHPEKGSRAGGEYRGFPNAVHKQKGSYFHAKNAHVDTMHTRVERVTDGYVSILASSESGHWQGRYEFFATHCTFSIVAKPADANYWILYEGTPGGQLDADDWWMTPTQTERQPIGRPHNGDIPEPEWMAFGDADGQRAIVLVSHTDDASPDAYYQMNNKMTVFGFGRQKLNAYHSRAGRRFSIGLVEATDRAKLAGFARQVKGANVDGAAHGRRQLGPRPGDVYREYAVHNGGNLNWRVTDPRAKNPGAKKFLPNPKLHLAVRDLRGAVRAEAVLDRWGGHAGTADKRIRFNDNDWITLPELTTTPEGKRPEEFHSQDNPVIEIPLDHVVSGVNTIEGTVGPNNEVSWGQWGLYSLILRIYYDPAQKQSSAGRIVSPAPGDSFGDNPQISVECDDAAERVDVLAWYDGYDEDGDGVFLEWHGSRFQPARGQAASLADHVGSIDASKWQRTLTWNTRWIPDQAPGAIRLVARIHDGNGLIRVTDTVERLTLRRSGWSVRQYRAVDVPEVFSVRVGRKKSCYIVIDERPPLDDAVEAVLHYRTWEADDRHHEPFQINGRPHANRGRNHHYDYDLLPLPVDDLVVGKNRFTIHSNTEHHMLEVLWPGPAITIRYRVP